MASLRDQIKGTNSKTTSYEELVKKLNDINVELKELNDKILKDLDNGVSRKEVMEKYHIPSNRLRQLIYRRKKK